MQLRSRRIYNKLPEVTKKKEEEKKRAVSQTNRLRAEDPAESERTWQSVAALVGMESPLHYSPTSSHSVFSTSHMSNTSTQKHLANTCFCASFLTPFHLKHLV
ncbi:hypothetical protein PAMP_001545 [Pampus punctatissimus]